MNEATRLSAHQEIPYSPDWERPWSEQSLAAQAAQAVRLATLLLDPVDGDTWCGTIDQARELLVALREVEDVLLAGFTDGWGALGEFRVAVLRQELGR